MVEVLAERIVRPADAVGEGAPGTGERGEKSLRTGRGAIGRGVGETGALVDVPGA